MPTVARVLIAEDHALLRAGLRLVIADTTGEFEVVGEADTCADTVAAIPALRPDVVLLDITLPDGNGLDMLATLKDGSPATKIVLLAQYAMAEYVHRAFSAGAEGYILKADRPDIVLDALRAVLQGGLFLSPRIPRTVLTAQPLGAPKESGEVLSERDRTILALLVQGNPSRAIAAQLALSERTIENRRKALRERFHCATTSELIRYTLEHRLLESLH